VAVPITLVGAWSSLIFFGVIGGKPIERVDALSLSQSVTDQTLVTEVGEWTRGDYEPKDRTGENVQGNYDFGQFSNSFTYESPIGIAAVSMDYPFTGGWHELSACYRASGWSIVERNAREENGRGYVEVSLKFPDQEQYGYLLFNNFNERGEVLTPPSGAILVRSWLFVRRRFLRKIRGDVYQSQIFVPSTAPLTEAEKASVKQLFFASEQKLTEHIGKLGASGD
jgi:hypothetical protein